jgi:hypothetical protein
LRRVFALEGADAVAKRREQNYQQLFPDARRVGQQEWRDDRERNEFVLAETYDLPNPFLTTDDPKFVGFQHRAHLIQSALAMPEQTNRRQPFALPFPCELIHTIELESPSLPRQSTPPVRVQDLAYQFSCEWTQLQGRWIVRYALKILAPVVSSEDFERHKNKLLGWWPCTQVGVFIPLGMSTPLRRRGSVSLLPTTRSASTGKPRVAAEAGVPTQRIHQRPCLRSQRRRCARGRKPRRRGLCHWKNRASRKCGMPPLLRLGKRSSIPGRRAAPVGGAASSSDAW